MLQLFSGPLATSPLWIAAGFQCLGVLPLVPLCSLAQEHLGDHECLHSSPTGAFEMQDMRVLGATSRMDPLFQTSAE